MVSPKLCSIKLKSMKNVVWSAVNAGKNDCYSYWPSTDSLRNRSIHWYTFWMKLRLWGWDFASMALFFLYRPQLACVYTLSYGNWNTTGLKNLGSNMSWPWIPFLEGMSTELNRCQHLLPERYFKVSCKGSTLQFTGIRRHHLAVDWQGAWPRSSTEESRSCVFYGRIRVSW